jgi:hypothetical protein
VDGDQVGDDLGAQRQWVSNPYFSKRR